MLKSVAFLSLVASMAVHAAEIKTISSVTNNGVGVVESTFITLQKWDGGTESSLSYKLSEYALANKAEEASKTIKQMVYKYHTEWSKPQSVSVTAVNRDAESYRAAATSSLKYSRLTDKQKHILGDDVAELLNYKSISLYIVNHGNGFGDCGGIVAIDTLNYEMALFESCYSE